MEIATRTSEGSPSECALCGKQMIVAACFPIGDATCPHCGSLLYPQLKRDQPESDDEKKLADLGVLVETNDEGEITAAQLTGFRFDDKKIPELTSLQTIPTITLCNTGFTRAGIERLRQLLPNCTIEEVEP